MTADRFFARRGDALFCEDLALRVIADAVGTPCYVYSRAAIERAWRDLDSGFGSHPHTICYAVKANSNLAVLDVLSRLGSGFDIVSGGELERVLAAGGDPSKVVFSGVAKTAAEIEQALNAGVACIDIESLPELDRIAKVAERIGKVAPIALRINPDVDAKTHPYIATGLREAKFGIPLNDALVVYSNAQQESALAVTGIAMHIGSQIVETGPYIDAVSRIAELVKELQAAGIVLQHIDIGGGFGIQYRNEQPPTSGVFAASVLKTLRQHGVELPVYTEPGRSIVGNAGVLLTRVEYLKENGARNFAIVDTGMNDLLRPALYAAWHEIEPIQMRAGQATVYDVVGPVCETGDVLGENRALTIAPDDVLAVRDAGAYGSVMSSNYNTRPRAAEVMVDGDQFYVVREREAVEHLWAGEQLLPK